MKKRVFVLLVLSILLFFGSMPIPFSAFQKVTNTKAIEPEVSNEARLSPVSEQQLKAQIQFFQEALDKLGATSPEQAAKLWAEGPKTRNGVLQYAVACEDLKAKIIKGLGKPEESFWNIGVSSPWVERYEIGKFKELSTSRYQTTIKYYWATSSGPAGTTEDTLTIVQKGKNWCVSDRK
jgi:hypothetical protein